MIEKGAECVKHVQAYLALGQSHKDFHRLFQGFF